MDDPIKLLNYRCNALHVTLHNVVNREGDVWTAACGRK